MAGDAAGSAAVTSETEPNEGDDSDDHNSSGYDKDSLQCVRAESPSLTWECDQRSNGIPDRTEKRDNGVEG